MSIKTYGQYKSTSTSWANRIPSHWEMLPAKRAFARKKELNSGMRVDNRLALTMKGVVRRSLDDVEGLQASEFETYQIFQEGNLAFKLIDLQNVKTSRVGLVPEEGIMSPAYIRLEGNGRVSPKYAYWYFMKLYHECIFNELGGGVRQTIGHEELLSIPLLCPPHSEQTAIASFLDRETAKIDALIAEQQRLIELLQEKRQAVISHAVTKGLDPSAPMKVSGVEWLGEVPEHWGVRRLRYIGTLQNGLNIGAEAFGEGDPFVSYGDVYNNPNIPSQPAGLVRSTPDDKRKYGLEKGDALFTRTSETVDDIGVASTCLEPVLHSTFAGFLIRLRPFQGVLEPRYSTHLFRNRGVKNHFAGTLNMVTRASLSQGELGDLPICIPPLEEQLEIAIYIEEMTEKSDHLISSARNLVSLLQERRSALISAAVTGQIDVRGLVPEAVGQ